MKLTFNQIQAIATGAMLCRENEDGTAFLRRVTESQHAVYPAGCCNYFLYARAAGITLDFYTDAEEITLTINGSATSQQTRMVVDLLEDGTISGSHTSVFGKGAGDDEQTFQNLRFAFFLKKGEKRVTVYFDNYRTINGLCVELTDGASVRPYIHKRTIIAFGDSITQGSSPRFPSNSYMHRLCRMLDARVYNFGVNGERFRKENIVPGTYPQCDFVTIALGTNDFGHTDSTEAGFMNNMPEFLRKAAAEFPDVPIFVLLPLWRHNEDVPGNIGTLQSVRDRIAAEAKKYSNMTVIDCKSFIPAEPKYFADLVLHPNDEGAAKYADALAKAIVEEIG